MARPEENDAMKEKNAPHKSTPPGIRAIDRKGDEIEFVIHMAQMRTQGAQNPPPSSNPSGPSSAPPSSPSNPHPPSAPQPPASPSSSSGSPQIPRIRIPRFPKARKTTDPEEEKRVKKEKAELKHDRQEKKRLVRDDRRLRRTLLLELRKDRATLKDIERAVNDLGSLRSSIEGSSKDLKREITKAHHDLAHIKVDVKRLIALRKREERIEEREHNHYLQFIAHAKHQLEGAHPDARELLEHEARAHATLYTQFTRLVEALKQRHAGIVAHEKDLESDIGTLMRKLEQMAHVIEAGQDPIPSDRRILAERIENLIMILRKLHDAVKHSTELEQQLVAFTRKDLRIERREMREDRQVAGALEASNPRPGSQEHSGAGTRELPASGGSAPIGELAAPEEHRILEDSKNEIAHALERVARIRKEFDWLTAHLGFFSRIVSSERILTQDVRAIAAEADRVLEFLKTLDADVQVLDTLIDSIVKDDSQLMRIVLDKGIVGRVLGQVSRSKTLSDEEKPIVEKAIRARAERIANASENLHRFPGWLSEAKDGIFQWVRGEVERLIGELKEWHALREAQARGRVTEDTLRVRARSVLAHQDAIVRVVPRIDEVAKGLEEYARLVAEEDAMVKQDHAFFERLRSAKNAQERLAILREA